MDVFLFGHGRKPDAPTVLSATAIDWFRSNPVERCIVFQTGHQEIGDLINEIKGAVQGGASHIEEVELPPINTREVQTPDDLYAQPWSVLTTIIRYLDHEKETVFLSGRSNALYDHVFWLAARCGTRVKVLDIDSLKPALSTTEVGVGGEKSPHAISGLLDLHLNDLLNHRSEDIGYSDAVRLAKVPGAGLAQGISPALLPYTNQGMVGKTEVIEGSVTYHLLPDGLAAAADAWLENRPGLNDNGKALNIVPYRLPVVQTNEDRPKAHSFDEFFWFMRPLQPVDGLITILQRHDPKVEGTVVLSLEEALTEFDQSDFLGDLRHAQRVLQRRSQEDNIQMTSHLVVINPVATEAFHFELVTKLMATCVGFEKEHGQRAWHTDLTMSLTPLRSAMSFFSFMLKTPTTYLLKESIEGEAVAKLSKRRLVIPVPNALAYNALTSFTKAHGNLKGAPNVLISLLLWESVNKPERTNNASFNPFVVDVKTNDRLFYGATPDEIKSFAEGCKSEIDLSDGLSNIHRTIKKYQLVAQGLIKHDGNLKRYALTDLGTFVATQMELHRRMEVAN